MNEQSNNVCNKLYQSNFYLGKGYM